MPELDRDAHLADFAGFIGDSPSSYHAAAAVAARLEAAGFERLEERDEWPSGPGRRVVVRDGAVIAWVQPDAATTTTPFRILGAHTDSPVVQAEARLPRRARRTCCRRASRCTAGRCSTPGSIASSSSRAASSPTTASSTSCAPARSLRIPQLAIHLDRDVNKGLTLDRQRHLQPVWGSGSGGRPARPPRRHRRRRRRRGRRSRRARWPTPPRRPGSAATTSSSRPAAWTT